MSHAALDTGADAPDALLERAAELSALTESLETVRRGLHGQVLLVGGEAGVGKTSLLRRFCEENSTPARVLWGACDPLFTPRPLGPLLAIGHESSGALGTAVESAMPYDVMSALADELRARAPAVFVLEDVHWADEATLDVFRLLARRVETLPALVVVSYRDDQLDGVHPLRLVLGELGTARSITRLKLGRLSSEAVAELAQPYHVDAAELYRKTAGNPFFVVEALAAGTDGIPDTVRDAVLARAARLSPDARALLEAVAVVPQHAEVWLLEALAESVESLDECLASGVLTAESTGVAFRHELARLAVDESIAPNTKVELHRRALAALTDPPGGAQDLARLAHHAEAAGDVEAVLRFAPAAAERAASLGAHREAAAQYARALRFGDSLPLGERADLLELRSRECYVADEHDAATVAIQEAIACRRELGQPVDEARALRWLSKILFCPGLDAESEQAARDAADLVEGVPPGPELAASYANLAETFMNLGQADLALTWGRRALELAERFGDSEAAVAAQITIAVCEPPETGFPKLEQSLEDARRAGHAEEVSRAYAHLVGSGIGARRLDVARRYLEPAIEHCTARGHEHQRFYLLAYRARIEFEEGRWSEATAAVDRVLCLRRTSIAPRIWALAVLGLVRARRGDPGYRTPLDEAWSLAGPTGGLQGTEDMWRAWPIATAKAEVAWLDGDREAMHEATDLVMPLFVERGWDWVAGELAYRRRCAGIDEPAPPVMAEPYALQLAGEWERAAELWRELGFPYEAALALADADKEEPLRRALEQLQDLGARRTAGIVARRLRERGARGLPRGPRPRTRQNPAGLTSRELEVLALLAEGLRNADIAARLVLSERTVGHHVGAILRKLQVRTRGEASAEAYRLGLVGQPVR